MDRSGKNVTPLREGGPLPALVEAGLVGRGLGSV